MSAAALAVSGALLWVLAGMATVPGRMFDEPYSTLVYSREGELMGARIAADGQWRFPPCDSVAGKFRECIVAYEDRRFFDHNGVDPLAVVRAVADNLSSRRIASGASTLTMQLARLAGDGGERNLVRKVSEALAAVMLEMRYGKERILAMYASHAPFGGNVVGVETAAWRYFGRRSCDLSWAESAMLAVLPNSPALIHPGRNREALRSKRDGLLLRLVGRGVIDRREYELAILEPLPDAPVPLPDMAPHLTERLAAAHRGEAVVTSVSAPLQRRVAGVAEAHARVNASNHIHNMAAIVADVESGEVLAYVGNVGGRHGGDVDVITAPRSTGSTLKPLLYAGMLDGGLILPGTLISDTPLNIGGFMPQNYDRTFSGSVPARTAIERSLNVPLVRMLSMYNTGLFMSLLRSLGMTTITRSEDDYGASIILGGAEGTLWDLGGVYASLARTMNHYGKYDGRYDRRDIRSLSLVPVAEEGAVTSAADERLSDRGVLSHAAIWFAMEAMSGLNRPEEEADWQNFSSMKKIAWKTGTSYGARDGWSVGVTPRYFVGVWVGNASGEGRPGLTGVGNAAPVMFDIFSMLPGGGWFETPYDDLVPTAVCRLSGHRASQVCEGVDTLYMPASGQQTPLCPYHRLVHLSRDGRWRVNSSCEEPSHIVTRPWFVLPPAQEYYYKAAHVEYRPLPPFRAGCEDAGSVGMEIIYPEHNAVLLLPKGFSGEQERFVFRAAHSAPGAVVYWSLDDGFIGSTRRRHSISCMVKPGRHVLTLTDQSGAQRKVAFDVKSLF